MKKRTIELISRNVYYVAWLWWSLSMAAVMHKGWKATRSTDGADHIIFGFVLLGLWLVSTLLTPWLLKRFTVFFYNKVSA